MRDQSGYLAPCEVKFTYLSVSCNITTLYRYFYATLQLGTPPTPFEVIVDTGSTITYVPCSQCGEQCGSHHAVGVDAMLSSMFIADCYMHADSVAVFQMNATWVATNFICVKAWLKRLCVCVYTLHGRTQDRSDACLICSSIYVFGFLSGCRLQR